MKHDPKTEVMLLRFAVIGSLVSRHLEHGDVRRL